MTDVCVELHCAIIDCIDDPTTLSAYSLTCKAFLAASRRRLFCDIRLFKGDMAERFIEIICSTPAATNPSLYVRHLCIIEGLHVNTYGSRPSGWINMALPLLTTNLLEVTVLELENLDWSILDKKARNIFMSGFQKVKRLKIFSGYFDNPEQMIQFIRTFPSLMDLQISHTNWSHNLTPTIPLPTKLQVLSLPSHYYRFERFLTTEQHPHLHTLILQSELYLSSEDIRAIGRFLNIIGSGLEHLDLGGLWDIRYAEANINLACCVNLHSIHVNFERLNYGRYPKTSLDMDYFCNLLSQIVSPHMVNVSFSITLQSITDLDRIDWTRLEDFLTNSQWANLQKISIRLFAKSKSKLISAAAESFRDRLPVLMKSSIFCIETKC